MFQLNIQAGSAPSRIVVGESYKNLAAFLPPQQRVVVVTDGNILRHYGDFFKGRWPVIEIGVGEQNKTLDTVAHVYRCLMDYGADRDTFVVGAGGGIVCDVAGFAASTYMRGLPFGFVSTTLLSQVDASVGGKNGVNFGGLKNMVGVFCQPRFVICDPQMLTTLPEREFHSGFAEIIKMAAIRNAELFDYLEKNYEHALACDMETLQHLIVESVKIKASVVAQDEHEHGERRILNFGHTFGHAVEMLTGLPHGHAVSVGMMLAAHRSVASCGLSIRDAARLACVLHCYHLPLEAEVAPGAILELLRRDKKRADDCIHLVLLNRIGKAAVCKTPIEEIDVPPDVAAFDPGDGVPLI